MATLLTARSLAFEVNCGASELVVTLVPVVLGAVSLSLYTADGTFLDLIHRSLGVGDCSSDTSSDTTRCANNTTDSPKNSVKRNSEQDSRAGLDEGSNGDSAEESLSEDHNEDCEEFLLVIQGV